MKVHEVRSLSKCVLNYGKGGECGKEGHVMSVNFTENAGNARYGECGKVT
jgi:hypothetical protein